MMNRTDREPLAPGRAEQMMKATRDMTGLKDWARIIERNAHAIYRATRDVHADLANRDPRVSWYEKANSRVTACLAAIAVGAFLAASIAFAYQYFAA